MLRIWEKIYGGKKVNSTWQRRTNKEVEELFAEPNVVQEIKGAKTEMVGARDWSNVEYQGRYWLTSKVGGRGEESQGQGGSWN